MTVVFVSLPILYVGLLGLLGATVLLVCRVVALSHELVRCRQKLAALDFSERQMRRRFRVLSKSASFLNTRLDELSDQLDRGSLDRASYDETMDDACLLQGYSQAIKLLALGLDAQDVADRCGFSKPEVELVDLLRNTAKRLGG